MMFKPDGESSRVQDGYALAQAGRPLAPSRQLGGVVAAAVTPCTPFCEVDPSGMRRLCQILGTQGCDGVFVLGSSGELPLLDEKDRRVLAEAAREGLGSDATLYVGISGLGLKQTVRYAKNAAKDGADVVVVMSPMMLKYSQRELIDYLTAVADASPSPVALYHHRRMPTPFEVETVAHLARHDNIVAMKDTSVDMERLGELLDATAGTGMAIMQGSEKLYLASLQAGSAGCVTALANVVPEWHAAVGRAFSAGNAAEAAAQQHHITTLSDMLFGHELLAHSFSCFAYALKRMLQHRGWLKHTQGLMPGFVPPAGLDEVIVDQLLAMELL